MRSALVHCFAALTLSLLAAVAPLPALAQCMTLSPLGVVGDIKGKPFQAELHELIPSIAFHVVPLFHEQISIIARDSQGRVRTETYIGSIQVNRDTGEETNNKHVLVQIWDPVELKWIWLDSQNKTARVMGMAPRERPANSSGFCQQQFPPVLERRDLGRQTIEGLAAQGVTIRTKAGETESWCSEEFKTIVLKIETPEIGGRSRTSMTNMNLGEPDPKLFAIPEGYSRLDRQYPH